MEPESVISNINLRSEGFVFEDLITGEINTAITLAPEGYRINYLWDTENYFVWIEDGKGSQFSTIACKTWCKRITLSHIP